MNLEQRIKKLEEQVGIKSDKREAKVEMSQRRKNIKTAHQYTIRNDFNYTDPRYLDFSFAELRKEGITEERIANIGELVIEPLYIHKQFARVCIKCSEEGLSDYFQIGYITPIYTNKDFLEWENSLFDELEIESDRIGMPYSGRASKEFLLRRAKETVGELRTKPKSFTVSQQGLEKFERFERTLKSIKRRGTGVTSTEDLDEIVTGKYKINSRGEIDVEGDVKIDSRALGLQNSILKDFGQFGKVTGKFEVSGRLVRSLEGCPRECGKFTVSRTSIENLKFMPQKINEEVALFYNGSLISFRGIPENLTGGLFVTSSEDYGFLDGFPKTINGDCQFITKKLTVDDILGVCEVKGKITTGYSF